ncbi:MAG TPA: sulfite exporter TauE/SafE family protein [Burkholderiales bacterium]
MTLELGVWALGFIALVCLLAGFAHGAIGFGFPIVATPLVALVIDIKLAIGLLAPITLVLVLVTAVRGGGLVPMARRFWYLPALVAAGAWLGTNLLLAAPPEPFILVLALVILLYLNLDRLGRGSSPLVQRMPVLFGVAFGFTAGVFEAIANVAGPVLLVYFMLLGLAPGTLVQALNLCFSFGKSAQVANWALSGAISPADWIVIGAFCIPSVAALFGGMRLRSRIDAQTYRRWLRKALGVLALLLIGQFFVSAGYLHASISSS